MQYPAIVVSQPERKRTYRSTKRHRQIQTVLAEAEADIAVRIIHSEITNGQRQTYIVIVET